MKHGHLTAGVVDRVIVASATYVAQMANASEWVELPFGAGIGWAFDGSTWSRPGGGDLPPDPKAQGRTLLTAFEWAMRFTRQEWRQLKNKRVDGTPAGDELDLLLDAIQMTNSVDVASPQMDRFYNALGNAGLPQSRIDELRQGE